MRFIADIAFVLAFFGVRICFLFPINLRALYYMGLHGMWSDLLVINIGCLVIGCFMHIYWTGQIVREIYYTVFGQNLKDIKDEERNHNKKID